MGKKYVLINTKKVKTYQKKLKLTNNQVAALSGLCPEYYNRFFKTESKVCYRKTLEGLARALCVPACELMHETK